MPHEDQGTVIGFGIVTLGILSSLVLRHSFCFIGNGMNRRYLFIFRRKTDRNPIAATPARIIAAKAAAQSGRLNELT